MCGICGIAPSDTHRPVDAAALHRMTASLVHRGPDDSGVFRASGVGLGSRRLSIVDLSPAGHMPMSTPDGRYWIVYNGEIYNFRELRHTLESRGWQFRSHTDTEVLLYLYADEGPAALDKLNGMFAVAIWDATERSLFLARDRCGIKPLFHAMHNGSLYFASEMKALWAAGVPARFDHRRWEELLCFRYIAGTDTTCADVQRLLPGHYLLFRNGTVRTFRWWHIGERTREQTEAPPRDPVSAYRRIFDDAVAIRRVADVPAGVFLSGGVDSGAVAATMAGQVSAPVDSYTARFDVPSFDEGSAASEVASRWHLRQHELFVPPDQIMPMLDLSAMYHDEPMTHNNDLYLMGLSRMARSAVTILLSGEGADEFLGGYVRYLPLLYSRLIKHAPRRLASLLDRPQMPLRLRKLARFMDLGDVGRFILFNTCDVLPQDLPLVGLPPSAHSAYREDVLREAQEYHREPVRQAMYQDQHTFIVSLNDRNDRMTMAASIECRVPFLDHRLMELASSLPTRELFTLTRGKRLLRRAMAGRLPRSILSGRKWGFGVPWRDYARNVPELRDRLNALADSPVVMDSPLDRRRVGALYGRFLDGDDTSFKLLFQILLADLSHQAMRTHSEHTRDAIATTA